MSHMIIRPGAVRGTIRAPPSKTYTHRALVVGHLTGRKFRVRGPLDADDTRTTAAALEQLGSPVHRYREVWQVGPRRTISAHARAPIRCGASGTTLRFVCALAALESRDVRITGDRGLSKRPMDELLDALRALGATCRHVRGSGLPINVRGPIRGGPVTVDASRSSQFASALLLALPTLETDSSLTLRGKVVSQPYLDATFAVLRHHGVRWERKGRRIAIPGRQRYSGSGWAVPGDASSAAYLWAAAAVSGGKVRVRGVSSAWPQADLAVLDLLERAGASVQRHTDGATVGPGEPTPFRANLSDAPDLYPLAGVLAALTPGVSQIVGGEHVVFKESNRKAATVRLARGFGGKVEVRADGLRIEGTGRPRPIRWHDLSDHRLVMSAAVGALAATGNSTIGNRDAVRKSFPGFWQALVSLGGGIRRA